MFTSIQRNKKKTNAEKIWKGTPAPQVLDLKPYLIQTQNLREFLRLDANENQFGCSPKVLENLRKITSQCIAEYPEQFSLVQNLAKQIGFNPNQLVLTNGGDEGIRLICETFLTPQDEILILNPTFSMYEFYAKARGASVKKVDYLENFQFPEETLMKSITPKVKLMFLGNPNNPTGEIFPSRILSEILTKNETLLVVVDEAYIQFSAKTYLNWLSEYPNLIILRSFSKDYGLAGLRLGVIVANKYIQELITRVKSPYNVSQITLNAAKIAITDVEYLQTVRKKIIFNRNWMKRELERMDIQVYQSEANFLLVDLKEKCNYIYNRLKNERILVRKFSDNVLLQTNLRISIGTFEQCSLIIQKIRRFLAEFKGWRASHLSATQNIDKIQLMNKCGRH